MATPKEKLAIALQELAALQSDGARVFRSEQLSRDARERLLAAGFIDEAMRGWLVSRDPGAKSGDTTAWFSSFWEFCARYCDDRFGAEWCLNPEHSLLVHAERTSVPAQIVVTSPRANNKPISLAHGTSLFALRSELPAVRDVVVVRGLRLFSIEASLARATEAFYENNPVEAQVLLRSVVDPSALLVRLLDDGRTKIAGRLAGAFRRVGRVDIADEIVSAMTAAGHRIRETDPFETPIAASPFQRVSSPFVARLQTLWSRSREAVLANFTALPTRVDTATRLSRIDDVYELDAYHSLSIEGYVVTPHLIERVASGAWEPDDTPGDRESRDALAARGYWLAFQSVRDVVAGLIAGGSLDVLRTAHREWYRQLFAPAVTAGLLKASQLAGYRNQPVYLRGSRHLPPRWEIVRDEAMPALFDLLEQEPDAAVCAVLGHWLVGYIHPFMDGNGRVARFLMNCLLVHGGLPWTLVRVEDRTEYLACLETASVQSDVGPFAAFLSKQVERSKQLETRKRN